VGRAGRCPSVGCGRRPATAGAAAETARSRGQWWLLLLLAVLVALVAPRPAHSGGQSRAANLDVPPEIEQAIDELYGGNPDAALQAARKYENANPEDPLGYLLEGEARWWELYCSASEIRWGMVDAWDLPAGSANKPYLDAAKKAIELARRGEHAEAQPSAAESGIAHLYAGMGYALEARYYGLRGQSRATARAGVRGRSELLEALKLDPSLADADTGLGLYNYYVDTLSPMVKLLRLVLGIPGGSKRTGIQQLQIAMSQGPLTRVEARFYLAKNLRTYDHDYAQTESLLEPLARQYPRNPIFLLLLANVDLELGRRAQAAAELDRLARLQIPNSSCFSRSRELAKQLLQSAR
jgi:hypothetical protein